MVSALRFIRVMFLIILMKSVNQRKIDSPNVTAQDLKHAHPTVFITNTLFFIDVQQRQLLLWSIII